ncbi:hypothetical protein [Novosphingobium sp.]|uniref:hypothetical protein n=1 Tax=Novosphingobium sp. TaxID=1874826 RepID=UPI00333F3510
MLPVPQSPPPTVLAPTIRRIGAITLIMLFTAAAVLAIIRRGPWYDEFYTFYLVRPGTPLSLLWPAWLRDNHPPLFYALAWLWARLLGWCGLSATVEAGRTINLALLALTVGLMAMIARHDAWFKRLGWYYGVALAAMFPALDQIDQLRSYFLSFALTALVLPLLVHHIRCVRPSSRQSLALGGMLTLAFSVHLVTTVVIAGLVAGVIILLTLARRRADAARLTQIAVLAAIPFAISTAMQLTTLVANTQTFWIPPGFNGGRWAIETELAGALGANLVLDLIALAGLGVTLVSATRRDAQAQTTMMVIIALTGGLMLALAMLVAVHLHRPLLITRYLVAVDPVVAFVLALGACRLARRLPAPAVIASDLAVLAAAALAIHANLDRTLHQPSWDGTGRVIAALVQSCPDTRVYPNMDWNANPRNFPPHDNHEVVPFAYGYVAQRLGFSLALPGSHDLSHRCPTLFWTEHANDQHPDAQTVIGRLRSAGYPIGSGRMMRIGHGWILVARP